MAVVADLTKGMNLWGLGAGVNMAPGEAQDCQDVLFRRDGALYKHYGWQRTSNTALAAQADCHKGFAYKGKNNDTNANTGRPGNFGIADDAVIGPPPGGTAFTRRQAFYSSGVVFTPTECRFWNPVTQTYDLPALHYPIGGPAAGWLPTGVTIGYDPKPQVQVYNNNVYIVGWADENLRYDPVDRVLYVWGWAAVPANAGHTGVGAGGALVANAVYRYRLSWIDLQTGEESGLSVEYQQTTTAANRTITLDNFAAYAGARHFWWHGGYGAAELTNSDVGLVVYRTEADRQTFHFLTLVYPDLGAATVVDNGLATDASLKADVRNYQDPPLLNAFTEFCDQWWGLSWGNNWARLYFNDFRKENSFWERWDPRDYRELPLADGEALTGVAKTNRSMVVFSNTSAYEVSPIPNATTGTIQITMRPLEWTIGCIGPRAWTYIDEWLYWLSDRGPYRWRPGMEPEWIGQQVSPMFVDTTSDLCQISAALRDQSEVLYDQDADVVRFIFACGVSLNLNRHLMYDVKTGGWSRASPIAQSLDYTNVYEPLVGGLPVTPFDKRNRLVFSTPEGYLYEYEPASDRGGVPPGFPVTGVAQAGCGALLLVTAGGLFAVGGGMAGALVEVLYADGSTDVRTIASNTAANIVPTLPFTQVPAAGDTWWAGGIPAYWRSWVEHGGDPAVHKTWSHLWLGYNQEFTAAGTVINVSMAVGDFPAVATRVRTADLSDYRAQLLASLTGRFFWWEFANSRPDEPFMITYFDAEITPLARRRV